jgi:hypothetical protein
MLRDIRSGLFFVGLIEVTVDLLVFRHLVLPASAQSDVLAPVVIFQVVVFTLHLPEFKILSKFVYSKCTLIN